MGRNYLSDVSSMFVGSIAFYKHRRDTIPRQRKYKVIVVHPSSLLLFKRLFQLSGQHLVLIQLDSDHAACFRDLLYHSFNSITARSKERSGECALLEGLHNSSTVMLLSVPKVLFCYNALKTFSCPPATQHTL